MSITKQKKEELINRYNELAEKQAKTKSWPMKGWYEGEMAYICDVLRAAQKEN